jgi:Ca2+/Na+ antiporter
VSFFFGAAAFYSIIAYVTGTFSRWVGIVLLVGFVVYMILTVLSMKKGQSEKPCELPAAEPEAHGEETEEAWSFSWKAYIIELAVSAIGGGFMIYKGGMIRYFGIALLALFAAYTVICLVFKTMRKTLPVMIRDVMFIIVGAAIIAGGANLLVDSGTYIATELHVPATVISLTFVALGTSLPELVTAITSLVKGHGSLSLGNIIGANLFNLVLVSGVSTVIAPFDVPADATIGGINASFVLDIPLMLTVMALMTIPALIRGKLSRWQGITLLCLYVGFCALQFTVLA